MGGLQSEDWNEIGLQFFSRERSVDAVAAKYTREELCDFVRENISKMEKAVGGMTLEQLAYQPPGAPGGWDSSGDEANFDASQIVTHVAMGTVFYHWGIARALGHPRPQFQRPPKDIPVTGKQGSVLGRGGWSGTPREELTRLLRETTEGFLSYVGALPQDVETQSTSNYGEFGTLTPKGWLVLAAMHSAMHLKQLHEMQSQPDYPPA